MSALFGPSLSTSEIWTPSCQYSQVLCPPNDNDRQDKCPIYIWYAFFLLFLGLGPSGVGSTAIMPLMWALIKHKRCYNKKKWKGKNFTIIIFSLIITGYENNGRIGGAFFSACESFEGIPCSCRIICYSIKRSEIFYFHFYDQQWKLNWLGAIGIFVKIEENCDAS